MPYAALTCEMLGDWISAPRPLHKSKLPRPLPPPRFRCQHLVVDAYVVENPASPGTITDMLR